MAILWSLVAMPTLCRAGILVECCTQGFPGHEEGFPGHEILRSSPDKCPGSCPCDTSGDTPRGGDTSRGGDTPIDPESSQPRDCDTCTESCNVVSTHSKPSDGDDFAVMQVVAIVPVRSPCDVYLPHRHRLHPITTGQTGEPVPIPASERPRLI